MCLAVSHQYELLGRQHVSPPCSLTIYWSRQHTLPAHPSARTRMHTHTPKCTKASTFPPTSISFTNLHWRERSGTKGPFFIPSMPRGDQRHYNHARGRGRGAGGGRERKGGGWIWIGCGGWRGGVVHFPSLSLSDQCAGLSNCWMNERLGNRLLEQWLHTAGRSLVSAFVWR